MIFTKILYDKFLEKVEINLVDFVKIFVPFKLDQKKPKSGDLEGNLFIYFFIKAFFFFFFLFSKNLKGELAGTINVCQQITITTTYYYCFFFLNICQNTNQRTTAISCF